MFDTNLVRLIDQRIAVSRAVTRATGTCVARATTGPGADVTFDGSTVAMPVKVLGTVFLTPGDRCVLDRYGTEWIVTGSFSAFGLGETSRLASATGSSSLVTSSTFVDLQEVAPFSFTKVYDLTYVRMAMYGMCVSRTSSSTMYFGLRITAVADNGYAANDITMGYVQHDSADVHRGSYAVHRSINMPAGNYTFQARWRRQSGTGSLQVDSADRFSIEIDEGVRASSPVL